MVKIKSFGSSRNNQKEACERSKVRRYELIKNERTKVPSYLRTKVIKIFQRSSFPSRFLTELGSPVGISPGDAVHPRAGRPANHSGHQGVEHDLTSQWIDTRVVVPAPRVLLIDSTLCTFLWLILWTDSTQTSAPAQTRTNYAFKAYP